MTMLIVCDVDGTITECDTLNTVSSQLAPDRFAALEGKLVSGEMTLREVLHAEMEAITASLDEVLAIAEREVPIRQGFPEFVSWVDRVEARLVLVSAGFRELIEPLIVRSGVRRDLEVIANSVEFSAAGGKAVFRDAVLCGACGEQCKRPEVERLMAEGNHKQTVYIGDGYSDRCAGLAADIVFARSGLAEYLDRHGKDFFRYETFHDVIRTLDAS